MELKKRQLVLDFGEIRKTLPFKEQNKPNNSIEIKKQLCMRLSVCARGGKDDPMAESSQKQESWRVLEFYSGIGGMVHYTLPKTLIFFSVCIVEN